MSLSNQPQVREARRRNSDFPPAMHGRNGSLDQLGDGTGAAEGVDRLFSETIHGDLYAIIGSLSQAESCDNRDCEYRSGRPNSGMDTKPALRPEVAEIFERLDRLGLKQRQLADVLGIEENKISKARKGDRQFKAAEFHRALEWLSQNEQGKEDDEVLADLNDAQAAKFCRGEIGATRQLLAERFGVR